MQSYRIITESFPKTQEGYCKAWSFMQRMFYLGFETRLIEGESEYVAKCRKKTGRLFA